MDWTAYLVVLEVEVHLGTPVELLPKRITSDGEGATGLGLPHVQPVVVVLHGDNDPLGNKVGGVEANTKLPNHGHIGPGGEGLHRHRTDLVQGLRKSHRQTHHVSPGTNLARHESNCGSTDLARQNLKPSIKWAV